MAASAGFALVLVDAVRVGQGEGSHATTTPTTTASAAAWRAARAGYACSGRRGSTRAAAPSPLERVHSRCWCVPIRLLRKQIRVSNNRSGRLRTAKAFGTTSFSLRRPGEKHFEGPAPCGTLGGLDKGLHAAVLTSGPTATAPDVSEMPPSSSTEISTEPADTTRHDLTPTGTPISGSKPLTCTNAPTPTPTGTRRNSRRATSNPRVVGSSPTGPTISAGQGPVRAPEKARLRRTSTRSSTGSPLEARGLSSAAA